MGKKSETAETTNFCLLNCIWVALHCQTWNTTHWAQTTQKEVKPHFFIKHRQHQIYWLLPADVASDCPEIKTPPKICRQKLFISHYVNSANSCADTGVALFITCCARRMWEGVSWSPALLSPALSPLGKEQFDSFQQLHDEEADDSESGVRWCEAHNCSSPWWSMEIRFLYVLQYFSWCLAGFFPQRCRESNSLAGCKTCLCSRPCATPLMWLDTLLWN